MYIKKTGLRAHTLVSTEDLATVLTLLGFLDFRVKACRA